MKELVYRKLLNFATLVYLISFQQSFTSLGAVYVRDVMDVCLTCGRRRWKTWVDGSLHYS